MSFDNSYDELATSNGKEGSAMEEPHISTMYETIREEFVKDQEETSIFDDNVQDILEMNAAIAMLTKNMVEPLEAENELYPEEKLKQALNQEDLEQTTSVVLAKLQEEQDDNVLYDSDGNPIVMYEYDVLF